MKQSINRIILLLLVLGLAFYSCMEDTSAYLSQEVVDVKVDNFDTDDSDSKIPEGELSPGINEIKLKININGVEVERKFKYFMPVSIEKSKPISLIFDFHGSYGTGVNPLASVSLSNPMSQLAIRENCIVVYPAGVDNGSAVNWQDSEINLPFVDAMLDFFNDRTPKVDENRIYTTGQSSGAIFSFVLAYERSEVFAAAVPVSGQMKLTTTNRPSRIVPIRAFNGVKDDTVIYSAALDNINEWSKIIGNYFPSDAMDSDTLEIDNYKPYLTKKWQGGSADIEFYSIIDEGHGISWYYIAPLIWEFMDSHPKNKVSSEVYLSSEAKEFNALEGETITSSIKFSEGATITLEQFPEDWTVVYSNGILSVTAPEDFFAPTTVNRTGFIVLTANLGSSSKTISIPYSLKAPKTYYEIGDVEYDSNFKPVGIVFWVNPYNIKEAKIIGLEHVLKKFGPLGTSFFTPSFTDGYANTLAIIERIKSQNLNLDASTSAAVYAYEYKAGPGKTDGWYLPAVDELKLVDSNLKKINDAIRAYGTELKIASSASSYHLSSTMVNKGTSENPVKQFYTFDYHESPSFHGYYILTASADNTAGFVSTRPVKKVVKK